MATNETRKEFTVPAAGKFTVFAGGCSITKVEWIPGTAGICRVYDEASPVCSTEPVGALSAAANVADRLYYDQNRGRTLSNGVVIQAAQAGTFAVYFLRSPS